MMNGFLLSVLEHFAKGALGAHFKGEIAATAKQLDAAQKGFPAQPTDGDRAEFCHAASYRLLREGGVPGSIAGAIRPLILDRLTAEASPKLSAGLTTTQAVRVVADAEIALIQGLIP